MNPPVFPSQPPAQNQTPAEVVVPVFVTVFLIVVIIATAITFILPDTYASTARIKLDTAVSSTNAFDPYFLQTEFEVIKSEVVLDRVIEKLDLNVVWGKKYNQGEPLKTADTYPKPIGITLAKRNIERTRWKSLITPNPRTPPANPTNH
jgi:hypothetical protein